MFNSIPNDQFSLSPFSLHGNSSFSAGFDPYRSSSDNEQLQQFHQIVSNDEKQNVVDETDRSMEPWSADELLFLLKVRSSMENWYPDFSWEHVSRKLGELGFKRSAEHCKQKFEEESGNVKYNRIFTELDEFYPSGNREQTRVLPEMIVKDREIEKQNKEYQEKMNVEDNLENVAIPCDEMSEDVVKKPVKTNKRKRTERFEKLKEFCVEIVNKMMAQQEELNNKLIDDIVRRDEDVIAREEARKNEEMVRTKMEIEKWAHEQAIANERQTIIIEFLKTFTFEKGQEFGNLGRVNNGPALSTLSDALTESTLQSGKTSLPGSKLNPVRKLQEQTSKTNSISGTKDSSSEYNAKKGDLGMRWPKDQVLALINLRCKYSNGRTSNNNEDTNKGLLWERISQGMMELGYERSAKRCKEKWENINKYYRKTKDSNKKRSVDSRTCPYFHELSRLHGEGTIVAHTNE